MNIRTAVYAGTFDPPTLGHLWVVEQAAEMFDSVVMAIGVNPEKKTLFSLEQRLDMLAEITERYSKVRVTSYVNQFLIHYAVSINAGFIIRGIRNSQDYEYERAMRHINGDLNSSVTTVFLMPPRHIAEVSSSIVKGLAGPVGWERIVAGYVPTAVLRRVLQARHSLWKNLCAREASGDEDAFWREILLPYMDASRSYHNWQHICDMLGEFGNVRGKLSDPIAVEAAIWFHDVVYDSRKKDNEEQSAEVARKLLAKIGMDGKFADAVTELILATKHSAIPAGGDAAYLVDLDLAILGKCEAEFDEYERNIRREYAWVPEDQFAAGRTAVLKGFLARPRIYCTEEFMDKYEEVARGNLGRSLGKLVAKSPS